MADHIGELPEVRRYLDDGKHNFMLHGGFGIRYIRESIADAALTAADREVGQLNAMLRSLAELLIRTPRTPHPDPDDITRYLNGVQQIVACARRAQHEKKP